MVYLKFAYLAEFAVAFNLAFGEFKQERITEELEKRITKLDNEFKIPLAMISEAASTTKIAGQQTDFIDPKPTWLAQSVQRFEVWRNCRKETISTYKPFRNFFSRTLLFSTNPGYLKNRGWKDSFIWFAPLRVIFCLPVGILASWTYSKTINWNYPPCRASLWVWSVLVTLCFFFAFGTDVAVAAATSSINYYLQLIGKQPFVSGFAPPLWAFGLAGIVSSIFCLRPVSAIASKFIGRYPPVPRSRYYSMVMVVLVSLILISLTLCEVIELQLDGLFFSRLSLFLFGFLTFATALPLLLFAGHLVLETSVSRWTAWAESAAKDAANKALGNLENSIK